MVVITIELWRKGDPKRRVLLGRAEITNTGRGTPTRGSYSAIVTGKRGRPVGEAVLIQDFPRKKLGAWDLLYRVLRVSIGDRNPLPARPWRGFGHDYVSVGQGSCGKCGESRAAHMV